MNVPQKVLGCDPGYERLGVALIERTKGRETLVYSACLRTSKDAPFSSRLEKLGGEIERMIREEKPDALALERLYFAKNQKTAMAVAEVRGMLLYLAGKYSLPVFEYTPMQVKVAVTGSGASDKKGVALMLPRLIELSPLKRLDDEMDAIAVALTCLASTKSPLMGM